MDLGLSGKKVLITASANGIGKATAISFLNEGARVSINGRDENKLIVLADELNKKYGNGSVSYVVGDATDSVVIGQIKKKVVEEWGGLDILVPSVGTGKAVSSSRLDVFEWEHMMRQNVFSAVEIINAFMPVLQKNENSAVVLISSVVALYRASAPVAYAAAKSALITLSSYMANEFAYSGVRYNVVVPGNVYFSGGRWEELLNASPDETKDYIKNNVPMGRFAKPEEVADTVVFLASARSSFTNGAIITVDGGQNRSVY